MSLYTILKAALEIRLRLKPGTKDESHCPAAVDIFKKNVIDVLNKEPYENVVLVSFPPPCAPYIKKLLEDEFVHTPFKLTPNEMERANTVFFHFNLAHTSVSTFFAERPI